MNKKCLKIVGTIFAFIYAFILYFLYDIFPYFFVSIFSPINDNILQYIKVLFGGIILSGVTQKIIIIIKKDKINNICISNFIGAITSIPIFLIIFLPLYNIIQSFVIYIISSIIAIVVAEIISYIIMNKNNYKMENKTIFLVIIVYILFYFSNYFSV